jgi:thiol:disulfide interchange protein DsbD
MVRLRQLLAFPLYATVAWLVWVLGAQAGNDAVMRMGVTLVVVAFALWAWRAWRSGGRTAWAIVASAGALAAALLAWALRIESPSPETAVANRAADVAGAKDGFEPWSAGRVAELTAAGQPVFVDFTAAWCITCQVNKRLVLTDARVRDAFANRGVTLLRADWTRRDPAISEALAALGRSGVPVYVLYRRNGEAVLLPEVLQRRALIDAIAAS